MRTQIIDDSEPAPTDVRYLALKWCDIAVAYADAHRSEAISLQRMNRRIGAPSVALSAIVATSIFAGIQHAAQSDILKWLLAVASMTAAGLAALVTFHNYAERATTHKVASEEYAEVVRRLQLMMTSASRNNPEGWMRSLGTISQTLDDIGRRVEIPSAMMEHTKGLIASPPLGDDRSSAGGFYGSSPGGHGQPGSRPIAPELTVPHGPKPRLQRAGFEDELERLVLGIGLQGQVPNHRKR
ncbi:SLATT domain-containing protein [Sorangium sp. So ce1153]|uniref:SLATT domain-containing protein n=1 Tax=Sorangium sp. So ce1153 TaxID=3133333 RepID=UPI003F5E2408